MTAQLTRDQRRSRRKRPVPPKTINVKRLPARELQLGRLLYPVANDRARPRTRGECADGPRPCPYVSCKYHLYLDVVDWTQSIRIAFPDLDLDVLFEGPELPDGSFRSDGGARPVIEGPRLDEMAETCALDVADRGGAMLEEVGDLTNVVRERIRQIEVRALAKLKRPRNAVALRDFAPEGARPVRRLPVLPAELDEEETTR